MTTHDKLLMALTEYDVKQSRKKGYNPYALSHYMTALGEATSMMESGVTLRTALLKNFCGRLLDVCLKSVGEPTSTKQEQRGW
jgi:hypothetical protein